MSKILTVFGATGYQGFTSQTLELECNRLTTLDARRLRCEKCISASYAFEAIHDPRCDQGPIEACGESLSGKGCRGRSGSVDYHNH